MALTRKKIDSRGVCQWVGADEPHAQRASTGNAVRAAPLKRERCVTRSEEERVAETASDERNRGIRLSLVALEDHRLRRVTHCVTRGGQRIRWEAHSGQVAWNRNDSRLLPAR